MGIRIYHPGVASTELMLPFIWLHLQWGSYNLPSFASSLVVLIPGKKLFDGNLEYYLGFIPYFQYRQIYFLHYVHNNINRIDSHPLSVINKTNISIAEYRFM